MKQVRNAFHYTEENTEGVQPILILKHLLSEMVPFGKLQDWPC